MLSPKDLEYIFHLDQDPLGANSFPKGLIEIPGSNIRETHILLTKIPGVMLLQCCVFFCHAWTLCSMTAVPATHFTHLAQMPQKPQIANPKWHARSQQDACENLNDHVQS